MNSKFFGILLLLLLLGFSAFAQSNEKSPLLFSISLSENSKEKGTVAVRVKLKNISDSKVIIDKNLVWYMVEFRRETLVSSDIGEVGPKYEGDYMILDPGERYAATKELKLEDEDGFFDTDEDIKLKITYGQFIETKFKGVLVWRGTVDSNVVIIPERRRYRMRHISTTDRAKESKK